MKKILHRVKQDRNILYKVWDKKANWICHILSRNSLSKHVFEGNIERTRRRGRRRKKLLDDIKETENNGILKRRH